MVSLSAVALFAARFAYSPVLWRENDQIVTRWQDVLKAGTAPASFLYLSLGAEANAKMTTSFKQMVRVLEQHAPAALRWWADLSAGGQHDSNPRLSTPAGLCVMFSGEQPCQGCRITVLGQRSAAASKLITADGAPPRP